MPEETVPVRGCYPFSQGCRISQPDLDVAWLFGGFPSRVGGGQRRQDSLSCAPCCAALSLSNNSN
jgi:hypothetical protein